MGAGVNVLGGVKEGRREEAKEGRSVRKGRQRDKREEEEVRGGGDVGAGVDVMGG